MDRTSRPDARTENGQATPFVIAVMALVTLVLLGVARLGAAVDDSARAHRAADAAALAGGAEGRRAATRLAADNGARLLSFRTVGSDTIVTVVVGRMRASARARAEPAPLGAPRRQRSETGHPV